MFFVKENGTIVVFDKNKINSISNERWWNLFT